MAFPASSALPPPTAITRSQPACPPRRHPARADLDGRLSGHRESRGGHPGGRERFEDAAARSPRVPVTTRARRP